MSSSSPIGFKVEWHSSRSNKWYQSQGHRFESLELHCEGGIVRDFTIRSNTNGLGLWLNAIKDLCPLILHRLVVGWIAHSPTNGIKVKVMGSSYGSVIVRGDHNLTSSSPIGFEVEWYSSWSDKTFWNKAVCKKGLWLMLPLFWSIEVNICYICLCCKSHFGNKSLSSQADIVIISWNSSKISNNTGTKFTLQSKTERHVL